MKWCVYIAVVLVVLGAGCASPNVDPARPAPQTGYADFFVVPDEPLCWQIVRMDDAAGKPVKIFEQFEPMEEPILRLAFPPGRYDLRVSILNHVVAEMGRLSLEIKDGQVTPVRITLTEAGKTQVETRSARVGGTVYGRFGRGTKLRLREAGALRVHAEPLAAVPYQPKAKMPYSQSETNLVQPAAGTGSEPK